MATFLDHLLANLQQGSYAFPETLANDKKLIIQSVQELKRSAAFVNLDTYNIESLLSFVETNAVCRGHSDNLASSALARAISSTISSSLKMDERGVPRGRFYSFMKEHLKDYFINSSFITFNYDLALESTVEGSGQRYSYGLEGQEAEPRIEILKLHGSINWQESEGDSLPTIKKINELDQVDVPLIVAPGLNKYRGQVKLSQVWQKASAAMMGAETLVFVGYGLPPTDQFFRYLLASSLSDLQYLRAIYVVDPSVETFERYLALFAQQLHPRLVHLHGYADHLMANTCAAALHKGDVAGLRRYFGEHGLKPTRVPAP